MPFENLIPIVDLFEAHLTVTDLDREVAFYRDQLALPLAHIFPERKVAFFWTGETTVFRKSSLVADNSASRSTGGRNL